jgi:H+/Cl- antiporter ClcA
MSATTADATRPSAPTTAREERRVSLLTLCLMALGVGIMTGVGAVALRALIGLIHNVMINGVFRVAYDANILEGPSRWGNWVILSPIVGGLVVVYLVDRFAPEAKGHGVPEVMDAVFYKRGNIRGVVALIKSLASALSIGSGASVGREGPIIQIGSALGSAFSQALGLSTGQKITLLSAGAGAGFPKLPGNMYVQNIIGMTLIGLMMIGCTHIFGHSYVDGVGYGVIQSILDQGMTATGLLVLLFVLKLLATTISLGCGASGGIFSPSLFLGATLGAAFASAAALVLPNAGLTLPSAAIVGMAAMVGAGTGGVMTAIIMVFEMTRDYAIIVPVIVAVAVAAGVRRTLIPETIYTIKLRHRGHRIPKERHVNLYLVQQAKDIMERRFILAKAGSSLRECMSREDVDDLRAIIVEQ